MQTIHHGVLVPSFPAAFAWIVQHARFTRPGETQKHSLLVQPRGGNAYRYVFNALDIAGETRVWYASENDQ
jgi:hypothetical protein